MFFNPLFISNASAGNTVDGAKENKFTNSNYLFADIINVSTEKLSLNEVSNIELESKNKALFKNFENLTFGAKNQESSAKNDYLGDDATIVQFLNTLLSEVEMPKNSSGKVLIQHNSKSGASAINPEIVNTIIEGVNSGEKFSIPIENNGKEIFVEIQKFDKSLKNSNSPKILKLTQSDNTNAKEIDYNQVISNIISSLKEKLSSSEFNMSEEKISQLTSQIEGKFSKLVSLNDETFTPQKNILSTLITGAQKELNLSTQESDLLKKTIVEEFVKVIKSGDSAEFTNLKPIVDEKESDFPVISNKLGLTSGEAKLLEGINLEKLTLPELSSKLKEIFSDSSQSAEVNSLLNKVEAYLKSNSKTANVENISSKFTLPKLSEALNLTPREAEIVKSINRKKITLPELGNKLKALFANMPASAEAKSLLSKVDAYIKSNAETVTTENISSKFTLPKISEALNLTPKETIVAQSLASEKVTLPELNNELKALENLSNNRLEIKSVINKMDAIISSKENTVAGVNTEEKLSLLELSQKLKLTAGETEAVQKESFKKVNVLELKEIVKEELSQSPKNRELKTLFAKLEKLEVKTTSFENVKSDEKIAAVGQKKSNDEPTLVNKVKTGIKNVFANKEVANSNEVEKEKYLVTLKAEKSPESLTLKDDAFVNKAKPELLNKTVFASKESVDLSKLRVVPLNENASKENSVAQDKDIKLTKASNDKNGFVETKIVKNESGSSSSNLGNKESYKNEQAPTIKIADNAELTNENSKLKPFEKMIIKNLEVESNSVAVKESKTESNILHKSANSDVKVEEAHFSKFATTHSQFIKNDLRLNQKNISKRINLKDLNKEISTLALKGGKKIIQFQLTPENLGKLDIRLEVVNKTISATIKVDNEATQQLVQNSLEGLKATLNQSGVQYNSLNVSLSNSEDKNQRYFKQKRKNNNAAKMNVEGLDETLAHKNLGYNKYDFIA